MIRGVFTALSIAFGVIGFTASAGAAEFFPVNASDYDYSPLASQSGNGGNDINSLNDCMTRGACRVSTPGKVYRYPMPMDGKAGSPEYNGCYRLQAGKMVRYDNLNASGTCDPVPNQQVFRVFTGYRTFCPGSTSAGSTCTEGGQIQINCRVTSIGTASNGSNGVNGVFDKECSPRAITRGSSNVVLVDGTSTSTPEPCGPGTYLDGTNCMKCDAGTYKNGSGNAKSDCMPCTGSKPPNSSDWGVSSVAGSTDPSHCVSTATACDSGYTLNNGFCVAGSSCIFSSSFQTGNASNDPDFNNGYVAVDVSGTTGPFTVSMTKPSGKSIGTCPGTAPAGAQCFVGLSTGNYDLEIKDSKNCVNTTTLSVGKTIGGCAVGKTLVGSNCVDCEAGTYKNFTGNDACLSCSRGIKNAKASPAPDFKTYSPAGADSSNKCMVAYSCDAGYDPAYGSEDLGGGLYKQVAGSASCNSRTKYCGPIFFEEFGSVNTPKTDGSSVLAYFGANGGMNSTSLTALETDPGLRQMRTVVFDDKGLYNLLGRALTCTNGSWDGVAPEPYATNFGYTGTKETVRTGYERSYSECRSGNYKIGPAGYSATVRFPYGIYSAVERYQFDTTYAEVDTATALGVVRLPVGFDVPVGSGHAICDQQAGKKVGDKCDQPYRGNLVVYHWTTLQCKGGNKFYPISEGFGCDCK